MQPFDLCGHKSRAKFGFSLPSGKINWAEKIRKEEVLCHPQI